MKEYIIDAKEIRKEVSEDEVVKVIDKIKNKDFLTENEVYIILDWVVEKSRMILENLGINIDTDTLDGWCDYFQYMTIHFFEKLGMPVTKNRSIDAFGYKFNHYFGTVTFPVLNNDSVSLKTYLIDGTYKQFFTKERCNLDCYNNFRYSSVLKKEIPDSPDVGYFVKDKKFASDLISNGYFYLNEESAYKYGEGFYLASLTKEEFINKNIKNINYLKAIMTSSSNYSSTLEDLDDFDINIENMHR